jgi:hypothetical protein
VAARCTDTACITIVCVSLTEVLDVVGLERADLLGERGLSIVPCTDGRRVRDVAVDETGGFVSQPGSVVWLGLHELDEQLLTTVKTQFGLREPIVEDANRAHQRAKLETYEDKPPAFRGATERGREKARQLGRNPCRPSGNCWYLMG